MKKYYLLIIMVAGLVSCKKWLDVTPQSEIAQGVLFSSQAGFEEALNGVYSRCTREDSYGKEITCGFLDVLAQNYVITSKDPQGYKQTSIYNYDDDLFINRRDDAWKALYAAIANSNLILSHIDAKKSVFTGREYELIKGEALALRAYLHFDLLRLFAPSFKSNPNAKAIPYVTDFTNKVTQLSTVNEVLTKIAADLSEAKELLRPVDPILTAAYYPSYPSDSNYHPAEQANPNLFLQNRRHRMNYYAVCGELARVSLYQEKTNEALSNAQEVINANKFPWTLDKDFNNADPKLRDRIMYKELLFAWYTPGMKDTLAFRFNSGKKSLTIQKDAAEAVYERSGVGSQDKRWLQWFVLVNNTPTDQWYELQKYRREVDGNLYDLVIPAIRLSEMYYIASECTYDTDPALSLQYLNTVRRKRNIAIDVKAPSREVLIQELVKEARKEFFGEGQLFYMYKRLNRTIPNQLGGTISTSDRLFVLPLPNDELEFGNR